MNFNFRQLFLLELGDMFNAEKQIINGLPNLINAADSEELKDELRKHLKETKEEVQRIKKIFNLLNEVPHEEECRAMEGILEEGREVIEKIPKSPLRDAALIGACQKVEHYEIATYGTIYAHAETLDFDSEILELIENNLEEEWAADKKLTKIAEGGMFSTGINTEAFETAESKR